MRQVLFLWPGSFRRRKASKLDFQKLAVTGRKTGTVSYQDLEMGMRSGRMMGMRPTTTQEPYIVAAHVTGNVTADADLYLSGKDQERRQGRKAQGGRRDKGWQGGRGR